MAWRSMGNNNADLIQQLEGTKKMYFSKIYLNNLFTCAKIKNVKCAVR